MRLYPVIAAAITVGGALPVFASPRRCEVTIEQAPEHVRAEIERAIATDMTCGEPLVVHVVPGTGGFRVEARDARGNIRSRVVPDAQTAAILVASWVADDRVRPDTLGEAVPPSVTTREDAMSDEVGAAAARIDAVAPARERWATVAGTMGLQRGVRAEVDLFGSRFTLGVAVIARKGMVRPHTVQRDLGAVEYLAITHAWYRWRLRAYAAAGFEQTSLGMVNNTGEAWARGTKWMFVTEASVMLSRKVDESWAVTAGFLLTVLPDPSISAAQMSVHAELPAFTPQLVFGVSRQL